MYSFQHLLLPDTHIWLECQSVFAGNPLHSDTRNIFTWYISDHIGVWRSTSHTEGREDVQECFSWDRY